MAAVYVTKSGDVWDAIAMAAYGSESYTSFLMENNKKYIDYFIFPEGIRLTIEDAPETVESTLPEWRQ